MTEKVWAEKWEELCECLKWGKNTPVETILLQFHAVNQGNQNKRKKLEAVKETFAIHYSTLHDSAWMDSKKMLKALDETAEKVREVLVQTSDETGEKNE